MGEGKLRKGGFCGGISTELRATKPAATVHSFPFTGRKRKKALLGLETAQKREEGFSPFRESIPFRFYWKSSFAKEDSRSRKACDEIFLNLSFLLLLLDQETLSIPSPIWRDLACTFKGYLSFKREQEIVRETVPSVVLSSPLLPAADELPELPRDPGHVLVGGPPLAVAADGLQLGAEAANEATLVLAAHLTFDKDIYNIAYVFLKKTSLL